MTFGICLELENLYEPKAKYQRSVYNEKRKSQKRRAGKTTTTQNPQNKPQSLLLIFDKKDKTFSWISRLNYNCTFSLLLLLQKNLSVSSFFSIKRKTALQYWSIPAGYWWMMISCELSNQWMCREKDLWLPVKTPIRITNCKKCHRILYPTCTLRLNQANCFPMYLEMGNSSTKKMNHSQRFLTSNDISPDTLLSLIKHSWGFNISLD